MSIQNNEDEIRGDAATNPGSPDPTLRGQESDEMALDDDASLGAPDKSFFQDEDAGSDGEPGAGRFGGVDQQFREELERSGPPEETLNPENAGDASGSNSPEADEATEASADF